MISELDMVVLTHDIDRYGLKEGDIGAVVHRYKHGEAFEVECVTADGRTIALLTLDRETIRPVGGSFRMTPTRMIPSTGWTRS
ncbi:MAG: DUF4926 domain-containing protein [Proteobacteria bacterium]|nr:DUF4926 domain-containing protein [Pseudomonadota bacterium]